MRQILFTATSYPRSATDWQSVFIREMLAGLARSNDSAVSYWGPPAPLPDNVSSVASESDRDFMEQLSERGGIAHLLRSKPVSGFTLGLRLIRRLRNALQQHQQKHELFHLNWLQSALAIPGSDKRALVTVLGSDYKLLEIPGITALLRSRFSHNRVVLAPNSEWMVPRLQATFGDRVSAVKFVPLGIDSQFYGIEPAPEQATRRWITVLRLTRAKVGPLLEWSRKLAGQHDEFHLIGPMQEQMSLPPWIHYHGAMPPESLIRNWYPQATAMITLSQHDEGRPQVLLEAMASGLPVIASRIPAHTDLLDSTQGGLLVSTQEEFAAALQTMSDERTRTNFRVVARQSVRQRYGTWDDCAHRYHELYDRLMAETAL